MKLADLATGSDIIAKKPTTSSLENWENRKLRRAFIWN